MKVYRALTLITVVTLVLAACSGNATSTQGHPPLKIGWIFWGGFYPLVIGHEKGFFEKHGVAVEPVLYEQYTAGFSDLQAGILDGDLMSLGDVTVNDGISPGSVRFPLITDVSLEAEAIVASPEIATPADLVGKTIGCSLGTYGELFVRRMLAANNISLASVNLVNVPIEEVPEALASGKIQAGHTWEPTLSDAIKRGNHVLYFASEQPGLITDGLAIRSQIAQQRPEDLRAFVAGWFETVEWWQANPEEGAQIVSKYSGLKLEEISTDGMKLTGLDDNRAAFKPGTDTTSVYFTAGLYRDFLIEVGVVTTPPDVDTMIDRSFLP